MTLHVCVHLLRSVYFTCIVCSCGRSITQNKLNRPCSVQVFGNTSHEKCLTLDDCYCISFKLRNNNWGVERANGMETVETEIGNENWKRKPETYVRTVTSTWQEGHCLRKGCVLALQSALAT